MKTYYTANVACDDQISHTSTRLETAIEWAEKHRQGGYASVIAERVTSEPKVVWEPTAPASGDDVARTMRQLCEAVQLLGYQAGQHGWTIDSLSCRPGNSCLFAIISDEGGPLTFTLAVDGFSPCYARGVTLYIDDRNTDWQAELIRLMAD